MGILYEWDGINADGTPRSPTCEITFFESLSEMNEFAIEFIKASTNIPIGDSLPMTRKMPPGSAFHLWGSCAHASFIKLID